MGRKFLKG
jgi:hypothetical protein